MTWGTAGNIITDNLDDATDSPADARPNLKAALDELSNVINGLNTSGGAAKLDSTSSKVIANSGVQATGDLTLSPGSTNSVKIDTIINLHSYTTAELNALTAEEGDVAYCSDGNGGSKCLAVYDGTDWLRIALGVAIST